MQSIDRENEFKNMDTDQMWEIFLNEFNAAINKFTPLSRMRCKRHPSWMTRAAKRAQKYKSNMWRRYKLDKSYNNLTEYKKARNRTTQPETEQLRI